MKTIALLLINVDSPHFFAANLLGIRENESEEHNYFPLFKKNRVGTKGAERLLRPPVQGEGCSFMKMCLAHPVFPLPLRTPHPSLVFLEKKKSHDKLQTFISPSSGSWEVEDHGASRSSIWGET